MQYISCLYVSSGSKAYWITCDVACLVTGMNQMREIVSAAMEGWIAGGRDESTAPGLKTLAPRSELDTLEVRRDCQVRRSLGERLEFASSILEALAGLYHWAG